MRYMAVGALIGIDIISGVVGAVKAKKFKSSKMREGLFNKAGELIEICFGILIDYFAGYLGLNIPFSMEYCIIAYISFMECGSIIENIARIDKRLVPDKVKHIFEEHSKEKEE